MNALGEFLRATHLTTVAGHRLAELVAELPADERFHTLWSRHAVQPNRGHGLLLVFPAAPGSQDAERLNALRS